MMEKVKQIAAGLWQGALVHVLDEWEEITEEVDVVLVMAEVAGNPFPWTGKNLNILLDPIDDDPSGAADFSRLKALAVAFCDQRVLTVCHAGENRSGLMSALILRARGLTPFEAVLFVQQNGPVNTDNDHSFWNPGFVQQVLHDDV